ncbi:GTP pyrophosphokinase [Sporanaerobacter acetigenes]|uniref:GTP pyrophosphokinase n=1 Tax=Sporanaerobacter acetigenes TaxID=165813 RepID=UPI0010445F0C|nr:hypothetical protein [Sporanaerobacter acetigenes]
MNEQEFIDRYEKEKVIYEAWGNKVNQIIIDNIKNQVDIEIFLKIDPKVRIKSIDSIIEKAFYRNKNYKDPYNEIEDKVGVRFVVLLLDDIKVIQNVIENENIWIFSKDRDFEKSRIEHPNLFGYESVHYVVKNKYNININKIKIPSGTPCEIQVRTLLQHAHAELTHDSLYKSNHQVLPSTQRIAARSMALIETTDYLFKEVDVIMNKSEYYENLLPELIRMYKTMIGDFEYEKKINLFILDAYEQMASDINVEDLYDFFERKEYLKTKIIQKKDISLIYRQPIILLLYYLITLNDYKIKEEWPLTPDKIKPLYSDLGIRF